MLDEMPQCEKPLFVERYPFANFAASDGTVAAVDIQRDRLEVLHQQRLEPDQAVELAAAGLHQGGERLGPFAVGPGIPVQVIDQRRIELLLRLEGRGNKTPDEGP